jgi:glycerol-3-phosphate dehydrogenase (NAD(P)+)
MTQIAVIGGGAWGTVFARVCADAGNQVRILTRDPEVADGIGHEHRNPRCLPDLELPSSVTGTIEAREALAGADMIAVAVRAQLAGSALAPMRQWVEPGATAVSLMKGIEQGSGRRMTEVIAQALELPADRVAVLSGPNLAAEIAERQPAATVIACSSEETAREVASACTTPYLRPYTNVDIVGVEVCGATKNIIAFAIGAAQGLGFGLNTTATLMTRGLAEMTRLGLALGADVETFAGLAGFGDLAATCLSNLSRNHQVGLLVGQGVPVADAVARTGGTAEAIDTSLAVNELAAGVGVEMPITQGVVNVVHKGLGVVEMGRELLSRPFRAEGSSYEPWPNQHP